MTTGEECTPEEWNVKQSETSNRKLNLRLQMFKEKIERAYVETLRRDGVISAELLKNHLQRINSVPAMLLEASRTELQSIEACIGKSKSKSTYRNNFYCDKKLSHFVSNKSKIDVPISILSIAFFDEYRFHLKKKRVMLLLPSTSIFAGWAAWCTRLSAGGWFASIPVFSEIWYRQTIGIPRAAKGDGTLPEDVSFLSLYKLGSCRLQSLRTSHIKMNGEGKRYIRKTR